MGRVGRMGRMGRVDCVGVDGAVRMDDVGVDDVGVGGRASASASASSSGSSASPGEESGGVDVAVDGVDDAFTTINDARHQLKFLVPNALSGCIIGKKGSNLERIRALSGAFIQANASGFAVHSHRHRFIIIAGDSMERCLHGLALLLRSVEEADKLRLLKANLEEDDPRLYLRQVIPGSCAGNIIGVKGGNLAKISRERGLSVFVEAKPLHASKVPFRIVSYAGSSVDQLVGGVRGVIDELQVADAYMEQYVAEIKEIKSVVIKVLRIPSGRVGALIGPKGAHLQALQDVLKCRLTISRSSDAEEEGVGGGDGGVGAGTEAGTACHYLTVWGQPDNVRAAVAVARLQGGYEVKRHTAKESRFSKESKESKAYKAYKASKE